MGSRKRADMDLESRAISARVTKQIVTIFSKACDNTLYITGQNKLSPMSFFHRHNIKFSKFCFQTLDAVVQKDHLFR